MSLTKKTMASLGCICMVSFLAACSASPESTTSPTTSSPSAEPSASSMTPTETSAAPETSGSPSPAPASSEAPASAGEIPEEARGEYVFAEEGESVRECDEDAEGSGLTLTVEATKISSFAFYYELEELGTVNDDNFLGSFNLYDDSDVKTPTLLRLETDDGWQSLELSETGTEQDADRYVRCP